MVIEQVCSTCRQPKSLTEFHKNRTAKNGHHRECKSCNKQATVRYRERQKTRKQGLIEAGDVEALEAIRLSHRTACSKWKRSNRDHWNSYQRKRNAIYRAETIAAYGGACYCCGETNELLLTLDHVNNDGAKQRKAISSAVSSFYYARRMGFPCTYRLACWNCNCGRQRNLKLNGDDRCPHQVESKGHLRLAG